MQERGLVPSVVDNATEAGTSTLGSTRGTTVFIELVLQLCVFVDISTSRVITVIPEV